MVAMGEEGGEGRVLRQKRLVVALKGSNKKKKGKSVLWRKPQDWDWQGNKYKKSKQKHKQTNKQTNNHVHYANGTKKKQAKRGENT